MNIQHVMKVNGHIAEIHSPTMSGYSINWLGKPAHLVLTNEPRLIIRHILTGRILSTPATIDGRSK